MDNMEGIERGIKAGAESAKEVEASPRDCQRKFFARSNCNRVM